jgi:hypothetical protein
METPSRLGLAKSGFKSLSMSINRGSTPQFCTGAQKCGNLVGYNEGTSTEKHQLKGKVDIIFNTLNDDKDNKHDDEKTDKHHQSPGSNRGEQMIILGVEHYSRN